MSRTSSAALRPSGPPTSDLRTAFFERLRDLLGARSFALVSGEFGREDARPVWLLTIELPNRHVVTVRAPIKKGDEPFAPEVCDGIAARAIAYLTK